ncbi:MAG: copper chaperone PCu(A)C [Acidimicrobiia bacterium]|nr:copper chaperone PCu(A)C [Acidimicrobiia bacterium]
MRRIALGLVVAAMVVACTSSAGIQVRNAVIAEPAGANTALYFEIENTRNQSDHLIGARTEVATAEVHRSFSGNGQMHMEHVTAVEIAGGEAVVFEPGGLHVMLLDVDRLKPEQVVIFVLEFEIAGDVEVEATVKPYAAIAP